MAETKRRRPFSRLVTGFVFLGLVCTPSSAQFLSIPVPEDAALEIVRDRIRPDGSQFLVLVRIGGSSPIKYVASREDVVQALKQQLAALAEFNSLSETSLGNLKEQQSDLEKQVRALVANKADLLQALAVAKQSQAELESALPVPEAAPSAATGEGANEEGSSGASGATSTTGTAAREAEPAASSVEEVLEAEPARAGLLSLPIDPDNVRLEMGRSRPDGSQFQLFVRSGGIQLQYVASRNDVVLKRDEELKLQLALHNLYERRLANTRTQNQLLDQKKSLLRADVADLQQAVQVSRQNIEILTRAIEAQKKSPFEIFIGVLPAIVGIIAVATAN